MFEFPLKKSNLLVSLITALHKMYFFLTNVTLNKKIKQNIGYVYVIVFIEFTLGIFIEQIIQINNTTKISTISNEINIIKLYGPC